MVALAGHTAPSPTRPSWPTRGLCPGQPTWPSASGSFCGRGGLAPAAMLDPGVQFPRPRCLTYGLPAEPGYAPHAAVQPGPSVWGLGGAPPPRNPPSALTYRAWLPGCSSGWWKASSGPQGLPEGADPPIPAHPPADSSRGPQPLLWEDSRQHSPEAASAKDGNPDNRSGHVHHVPCLSRRPEFG